LSRQCGLEKPNGDSCKGTVREGDAYCWAHDAKYEEARRRGQSRGGRNKPSKELQAVKAQLLELAQDTLEGNVERADAAVASQVLNVYLRAVSVELKAVEQLELIEPLEALEEANVAKRRNQPWGA